MLHAIEPSGQSALAELARLGPCLRRPAELAEAIGAKPGAVRDALADLERAGWVASWSIPGRGRFAILSPEAAESLGLDLVADPDAHPTEWTWAKARRRERTPAGTFPLHDLADEDPALIDPGSIDPAEAAEAAEAAERWDADRRRAAEKGEAEDLDRLLGEPPTPKILVGSDLSPWQEGQQHRRRGCPGCGDRRMRWGEVCLVCLSWCLDHTQDGGAEAKAQREGIARRVDRDRGRRKGA